MTIQLAEGTKYKGRTFPEDKAIVGRIIDDPINKTVHVRVRGLGKIKLYGPKAYKNWTHQKISDDVKALLQG